MADFLRLSNRCVPACAKFLCGKCFCWGRVNGDRPLEHDTAFSRCCSDFISFPVIQSFFCTWLLPANHVLFFRLLCPSSVTYCRTEKYRWNSFNSLEKPSEDDFVNVEYINGMFRSKKELLDFILQKEEKKCMEYENKIVFSDDRAAAFIGKLFGISSPYKLERLKIDEQIKKCRIMRNRGLSASQITRITGISRRIIRMAKS